LPPIRQLAVVGIEDARMGEKTALVCSLHEGFALELHHVTEYLDRLGIAKYKWPEHLIVLDQLPTTATGKVAKKIVRTMASQPA
jgi:cyclohexanecarboxylate-CoA ligase